MRSMGPVKPDMLAVFLGVDDLNMVHILTKPATVPYSLFRGKLCTIPREMDK